MIVYRDSLPIRKAQRLFQRSERDCGVAVFAALATIPEATIRCELPDAVLGRVSEEGWINWLTAKGFVVTRRDGCPGDILPCAHLVMPPYPRDKTHWVFRDEDGDVHDPSSRFQAMSADNLDMRRLAAYWHYVRTYSVRSL